MDKLKALIYLNQTGNEALDQKAMDMLYRYCEKNDYEPVIAFGEDTSMEGISTPIKYMLIGLAAESQIDIVVTMFSEMISKKADKVLDVISFLDDYEVSVETIADDMDEFYYEMFEMKAFDGSIPDEDAVDSEVMSRMTSYFAGVESID